MRTLTLNEVYCVACDSAPCVCGQDHPHDGRLWRYCADCAEFNQDRRVCPKCGEATCFCYFTTEELDFYRGRPSPVFPARFAGRCKRCTALIDEGEPAQMINGLFGHPFPCPDTEKDETMSQITYQIAATERMLGNLYAQREVLSSWGKDADYPNETVLFFKQSYPHSSQQYDYVAVKIRPNTWYLTGKWSNAIGFDDLVVKHLAKADEVWVVTAWEQIGDSR